MEQVVLVVGQWGVPLAVAAGVPAALRGVVALSLAQTRSPQAKLAARMAVAVDEGLLETEMVLAVLAVSAQSASSGPEMHAVFRLLGPQMSNVRG